MKQEGDKPSPSHWLSADRPIESRSQDELGRRNFSESLASAIRGWSGQESLVLALYGAWGNGKSSIKNMVVESLDQTSPAVRCVDFNPWQLANRPSLSEAFFDELGVALDKGDLGTNSERRSTLDRFRRWALRLQGAHDLAKATRNVVATILIFFGLIVVGPAWMFPHGISIAIGALALLMGVLALSTSLVEATVKFLAAGAEIGRKSLGEVKKELSNDLKKLKTPILFIIDDLDRLTPQEILEVFQLIKANGDFPNVIYLILCDRSIVETNLERAINVSGREYLEKIVQVAFDVPMIDIERVRMALFGRLNELLAVESVSKHFDTTRWANVFWSGLFSYFSTLRDVNRFVSTLAFQISSFSEGGAFEVNPIDLIALETIRLNEPAVYKALQSSKEILTQQKTERRSGATKQALETIIEMGAETQRSQLRELLRQLFPPVEWALDGPNYSAEFGPTWYRDLRICSGKLFDRYFRLAVSGNELSQAEVQKLLGARGDRAELGAILQSLAARGLSVLALEELGIYQDELKPNQVEPFVTAIFDSCDTLPDGPQGGFEIPIQWRIGFLVQHALEKLDGPEHRAKALAAAIRDTSGLNMAIEVAEILTATPERKGDPPFLPEAQAAQVREAGLLKIKSAASSGTLEQNHRLATLLHTWRRWGSAEDVARYTDRVSASPKGLLTLLKSLELRSFVQQLGDHAGTERRYFQRNDIEPLISMDSLNERVKALNGEGLDEEGRGLVENFQKAMERRLAGKPDSGPFVLD